MNNKPASCGPVNGVVRQSFDTRLHLYYKPGILFFKLESEMYPNAVYPKYYNFPISGGPPGGRRSFVSALTRRGIKIITGDLRICHGCLPNPADQRAASAPPESSC